MLALFVLQLISFVDVGFGATELASSIRGIICLDHSLDNASSRYKQTHDVISSSFSETVCNNNTSRTFIQMPGSEHAHHVPVAIFLDESSVSDGNIRHAFDAHSQYSITFSQLNNQVPRFSSQDFLRETYGH